MTNNAKNSEKPLPLQEPIAVIGIGSLFPGATNAKEYWQNILNKKDFMTEVSPIYWLKEDLYDSNPKASEKSYCKRGAFLPEVPLDPTEFGIPPNVLPSTDSSQLLALLVAKAVLEDAMGQEWSGVSKDRTSVILGYSMATALLFELAGSQHRPIWKRALRDCGIDEQKIEEICKRRMDYSTAWDEDCLPGLLQNVIAGRIANRFDLRGTNCVIDAACASTFSAIHLAIKELILGDSDLVITGGVQTLAPLTFICFSKTPALSPSGESRPFDASADGMMLGEGVAMFALRRLEDAERDGNKIYAVIRGVGTSSDGRSKSIYAPEPKGQALALRRAYERAGYGPETVELVEAHGTGTKAGDAAELIALKEVFSKNRQHDHQWCAVGSIKSQIGHTLSTAGAAGLFKAILALHHKVLPPTINVTKPNQGFDFSKSPFYINSDTRPWIHSHEYPRRASVSSFGFGGTNFHITLEEYQGAGTKPDRLDQVPAELILLAASSASELIQRIHAINNKLAGPSLLSKIAAETQTFFEIHQPYRLAIVSASSEDLTSKLQQAENEIQRDPNSNFVLPTGVYYLPQFQKKKMAFLFPGQGSQYPNMGSDLATRFDCVRETWDQIDCIRFDDSPRLSEVVFPLHPFSKEEKNEVKARLTATEWAQPCIGATSASMLSLIDKLQLKADFAAGHSFGEVAALYYAGVFELETFLKVARKRGELMGHASYVKGGMVSVMGPTNRIHQILTELDSSIVISSYNAPNQSVISGETNELYDIQARLEKEGMKTKRLNVDTAFHSPLVSGIVDAFYHYLSGSKFKRSEHVVYSNTTASPMPSDVTRLSRALADHLGLPVRFWEEIQEMYEAGANVFVEVGPGSVLTKLVGECLAKDDKNYIAINLDSKGRDGITSLYHALARLSAAGVSLNLDILREGQWSEDEPKELSKSAVMINGTTYKKNYPPPELHEVADAEDRVEEKQVSHEVAMAVGSELVTSPEAMQEDIAPPTAQFRESAQTVSAELTGSKRETSQEASRWESGSESFTTGEKPMTASPNYAEAKPIADPMLSQTLLEVVADKTGYPIDILKLDMHLEADLGIDSIKRVEIMSAVREKLPNAPEADSETLSQLETLGTIVEFLAKASKAALSPSSSEASHRDSADGRRSTAVAEAVLVKEVDELAPMTSTEDLPQESPPLPLSPSPSANGEVVIPSDQRGNVAQILLEVVADKTGYPIDILKLDMHLEADLGIDSIKRVEIMSAVREELPNAPEVDSETLAQLQTLGEIVDFLGQGATPMLPEEESTLTDSRPVEVLPVEPTTRSIPVLTSTPAERFTPELQESRSDEVSLELPAGIGRYELKMVPLHDRSTITLAPGREILIVGDGQGIAEEMVASFQRNGFKSTIVQDASEITPDIPCGALIHLGGLRKLLNFNEGVKLNKEAFRIAKAVASRINDSAENGGGWFITVQDLGGDFGLMGTDRISALRGGLAGLTKTLSKEWIGVYHKVIDIDSTGRNSGEVAEDLVNEMLCGGNTVEVGLSATGDRSTIELVPVNRTCANTKVIDENSVIVASGGARGVTAASLIELARQTHPKFVLLGRSAVLSDEDDPYTEIRDPSELKKVIFENAKHEGCELTPVELENQVRMISHSREIKDTITALQKAGSEVRYYAVDIQESRTVRTEGPSWTWKAGSLVRSVLEEVRREWGPITGLVHGAGVIADKLLTDKTIKQFELVFNTKVRGLDELLSAVEGDPLKFICVFSSTAARLGSRGQSDYAMGNEVLNKMAQAERIRRGGECLVKSINWGPWEGGMVNQALRHQFSERKVPLIPLDIGSKLFVEEIQGMAPHKTEVIIGGVNNRTVST